LAGKFLLVDLCNGRIRLGITVTRRYGKAVLRNRAKRLIRESFRQLKSQLPAGCDIHIRPRRALQTAKQPQVQAELLQLITSIEI
jgi:ribonuclease P protein component